PPSRMPRRISTSLGIAATGTCCWTVCGGWVSNGSRPRTAPSTPGSMCPHWLTTRSRCAAGGSTRSVWQSYPVSTSTRSRGIAMCGCRSRARPTPCTRDWSDSNDGWRIGSHYDRRLRWRGTCAPGCFRARGPDDGVLPSAPAARSRPGLEQTQRLPGALPILLARGAARDVPLYLRTEPSAGSAPVLLVQRQSSLQLGAAFLTALGVVPVLEPRAPGPQQFPPERGGDGGHPASQAPLGLVGLVGDHQ